MRTTGDPMRRGGFTVIEALIVLVILGIIATIAVDSFRGLGEKYRVEGETKQLYADLMEARSRAMQRNRAAFVQFTSSGYATYEDTFNPPDGDGTLTPADTRIANVTIRHGISPSFSDNLVFRRNGTASVTGYIQIVSAAKPDYDCVGVGTTRLNMGKYGGGSCVER